MEDLIWDKLVEHRNAPPSDETRAAFAPFVDNMELWINASILAAYS